MAYVIDTNVAIHLRDGDTLVTEKIAALNDAILMSVITRVELEGGVHRDTQFAALRRARLDAIFAAIPALAFDNTAADACADIIARYGYSRRKLLDRMIAAQALVHKATLVTINRDDFAEIANLQILAW